MSELENYGCGGFGGGFAIFFLVILLILLFPGIWFGFRPGIG